MQPKESNSGMVGGKNTISSNTPNIIVAVSSRSDKVLDELVSKE